MAFISRASVRISLLSEHITIVSQQLGRFHWFHWSLQLEQMLQTHLLTTLKLSFHLKLLRPKRWACSCRTREFTQHRQHHQQVEII